VNILVVGTLINRQKCSPNSVNARKAANQSQKMPKLTEANENEGGTATNILLYRTISPIKSIFGPVREEIREIDSSGN
jgi:hypothetical protein